MIIFFILILLIIIKIIIFIIQIIIFRNLSPRELDHDAGSKRIAS
jgi:hypothetical protein